MKTYFILSLLVLAVAGCSDAGNRADDNLKTNAAANDSTQAPNGAGSSSATSTNPDATKRDTTHP